MGKFHAQTVKRGSNIEKVTLTDAIAIKENISFDLIPLQSILQKQLDIMPGNGGWITFQAELNSTAYWCVITPVFHTWMTWRNSIKARLSWSRKRSSMLIKYMPQWILRHITPHKVKGLICLF